MESASALNIETDHASSALWRDFRWLASVMNLRLDDFKAARPARQIPDPGRFGDPDDPYNQFLDAHAFSPVERIVLVMALIPEFMPSLFLDLLDQGAQSPEIGLIEGKGRSEWLPTLRTALFLLGGYFFADQLQFLYLFEEGHVFQSHAILLVSASQGQSGYWNRVVRVSRDTFSQLTTGKPWRPDFAMDFPAKRVVTSLTMEDLVLDGRTLEAIREVRVWLDHRDTLLEDWGMGRILKPGYKALFVGPPGTGKTLTASLLGKYTGHEVYKIDLSQVVSKYIGETEKNLSQVFNLAENKRWILFFDEADALFGKRGRVSDARDRYANQEVSYLLQRVEDFPGLAILASNFRSNLDDAFLRRFQTVVNFPFPQPPERLRLWKQTLPKAAKLETGVNLLVLAKQYEVSGSGILNVVQFASLRALERGDEVIRGEDLVAGIEREYEKEGKVY